MTGQKLPVVVNWILGADTNVTWKLEAALSTGLGATATVDVIFVKTPTAQSGQYVTRHELQKDYRLRARLASTGANAAASIRAEVLT